MTTSAIFLALSTSSVVANSLIDDALSSVIPPIKIVYDNILPLIQPTIDATVSFFANVTIFIPLANGIQSGEVILKYLINFVFNYYTGKYVKTNT